MSSKACAVHLVVQRYRSCRLLVDESRWVSVPRPLSAAGAEEETDDPKDDCPQQHAALRIAHLREFCGNRVSIVGRGRRGNLPPSARAHHGALGRRRLGATQCARSAAAADREEFQSHDHLHHDCAPGQLDLQGAYN